MTDTENLREQFEAWARKNELEAERHKYADDQYDDHAATSAWWAWRDAFQAGHAAAKAETAAAAAKEREWANRSAHDLFLAAFDTYLDEVGVAGALSAATTIFVSLVVSYTKACGHDADRPITINGGENRDVTIHALKEGAASA